ncbi:MAG TPA: NAD-dependent protein deacetylase [Jiangellaceae bacterium]
MEARLAQAVELLARRRLLVLTGAGISTDSGIPDYRGNGTPRRTPMMYSEFRGSSENRRRYWARSHVGWRRMSTAEPNVGHRAVAELERSGSATGVITQNVDGLHIAAGSRTVVELHGRLADVVCLDCGDRCTRTAVHQRLAALNPEFNDVSAELRPDGDVDLEKLDGFVVAGCEECGGVLKPDVVFFGENVPRDRVATSTRMTDEAEALLVAGSSLAVLSGYRFVRQAHARGIPVAIVNRGATRGDDLADVKIDAGCSETLNVLAESLAGVTPGR